MSSYKKGKKSRPTAAKISQMFSYGKSRKSAWKIEVGGDSVDAYEGRADKLLVSLHSIPSCWRVWGRFPGLMGTGIGTEGIMDFGWSFRVLLSVTSCTAPFSWPGNFRGILCNQAEARVFHHCPQAMCHLGWWELTAALLHTCTGLPHPVPTGFGKHTNKIIPHHHQKNPAVVPFSQSMRGK